MVAVVASLWLATFSTPQAFSWKLLPCLCGIGQKCSVGSRLKNGKYTSKSRVSTAFPELTSEPVCAFAMLVWVHINDREVETDISSYQAGH